MWRRMVVWVVVVALACGPVRRCEGGCDGVDGGVPAAPRLAPTELGINPRVRGLSPPPWLEEG
jgi:hypothetical protein